MLCGLAAVLALAATAAHALAQSADRVERRSEQMALPDTYLDPSWPDDGSESRIAPEESDNVQEVPLDDEKLDPAEAQEAERYKEELGRQNQADDMQQDQMGGTPEQPEPDNQEARDPAQW
jgi:hypothetical protein